MPGKIANLEAAEWDDLDWGSVEPELPPNSEPEPEVVVAQPSHSPPASAPVVVSAASSPPSVTEPEDDFEPPPPPVLDPAPVRGRPPLVEKAPLSPAAKLPGTRPLSMKAETVAQLTVTLADGSTQEVTVSGEVFSVGRRSDNDLAIKDRHVSGAHARLVLLPDGAYELHDLDSSGGTLVNDLEVHEPTRLASGDVIEFSTIKAVFQYTAGPPVEDDMEFGSTLPHTRKKGPAPKAAPVLRQPRLVIAMPDGETLTVEVSGEMSIGRIEGNDVIIPQDNVSSQHAQLICHQNGIVELIDLNSTCGTFVNGKAIGQKSLAGGELLRFGVVDAMFETPASAAKAAGVPAPATGKPLAAEAPLPQPKRPQRWQ